MTIDTNWFAIAFLIVFLLAGFLGYLFWKQRKQLKEADKKTAASGPGSMTALSGNDPATRQMQLQAYERLILLTDRIAIPNLIQRVNQGGAGLSARDMQSLLTHSIRQEFEHNITQQIYVSADAWDAVRNFKEQNLLIINQVGSFLPGEASGNDLNRQLLDLLVQNPKASLQNVVAEALSYEAKKLL
ncbi:MAG TPA: hypothetical protein VGM30_09155 [Puia sp.]|jgi:hypothetical protein